VHAKWAMSLDGKIATATGDSKWISNEASRRKVHELRGRMDGILVGIGTAIKDDPLLTVRPPGPRTPCRLVLDTAAKLPLTTRLIRTAAEVPTMIVTTMQPEAVPNGMTDSGCEILTVPGDRYDRPDLLKMLDALGRRRWTNLLVEGGAAVFGSLFDQNAVDEIHVFVAPKLIGGVESKSPVSGFGRDTIAQSGGWITECIENLDGDAYLRYIRNNT
jgi:diaminohydroxyphosphoribosylaminopyrimidine deaminase/5-amino-6-(5-phosphoribosylamino)uracil reductase